MQTKEEYVAQGLAERCVRVAFGLPEDAFEHNAGIHALLHHGGLEQHIHDGDLVILCERRGERTILIKGVQQRQGDRFVEVDKSGILEFFIIRQYGLKDIGTPIERCSAFAEPDGTETDRWVVYIDRQVTLETAGTNGCLTGLTAGTKQDCQELVQLLRNAASQELLAAWDNSLEANINAGKCD